MPKINQVSGYMTRSRSTIPQIVHDADNREFFFEIGNDKAFLSYRRTGNVLHMDHTVVPDVFHGKGYGKLLAKVKTV